MRRAMGISVHTGWGACVVVGGSPAKPQIVANQVVEVLGESERFCFHRAVNMTPTAAAEWLALVRDKALASARLALAPLIAQMVDVCAIISKEGDVGDLGKVLASHTRIHSAEGFFYRDVFRAACTVPAREVSPTSLNISKIGKLAAPPWGRDQKLAAVAAWSVMY
jgi:hypothetical protein